MNRIVLIGRLTKEPELRTTSNGKDIVNFSIAVNKKFKREEADFFSVQAWESTARYVAEYLGKGRLVAIDGRLETRSYEKDGKKIYITEVIAEQVTALDRARDEAGANTSVNRVSQPKPSGAYSAGEYDPFGDE
jgi:single-strand DNA-binding protein